MMGMSIEVRCADKYEAQKMASMILVKKSLQTYIDAILDIIENEMVVSLKDKSAHSLVMYDKQEAETLAGYMQSVFDGSHKITAADVSGDVIRISKG